MVRKLFKHEFLSYARIMLPIYAVLIGVSGLNRLIQLFEQDGVVYGIAFVSSIIAYVVSIVLALVLTYINAITRYYKNLFTGEGYLSFTLPVTPTQHLWVKSVTVLAVEFVTLLVILGSVAIITSGDVLTEIFKSIGYLYNEAEYYLKGHLPFYIAEVLVLMLVTSFTSIMMFYFCITLGQLARKNRVLAAVGVYFGLYMLSQAIYTVGMIILSIFGEQLGIEALFTMIAERPLQSAHWILGSAALLYLLGSAVYFLICRAIIKNKLNLE